MPKTDLSRVKSVIFSCAGPVMTEAEKAFFADAQPLGFILFGRNVETPDQVRTLIADFRRAVGRPDAPVLIDQEGGRVKRLRPPHWFDAPAFGVIGKLYTIDPKKAEIALRIATKLIADDLVDLGITVDCSPCLDLGLADTSAAIGDRAFAADPDVVARLGEIARDEFQQSGIVPVIKHIPGHGRGTVDSHHTLPVVAAKHTTLSATDFVPFQKLATTSWGMTAHIVFEDIDPDWPATQSRTVIEDIIRGEIGFDGLLLTDDLNMQALKGTLADRARRALDAGIDIVLHCSGILDEMKEVAAACGPLSDAALERIGRTEKSPTAPPAPLTNRETLLAELQDLLALVEVA